MVAATALALGSAVLHVIWNLLIRTSDDRLLSAWAQSVAGGLVLVPLLAAVGPPDRAARVHLAGSCLVHVLYVGALARNYDNGEFSFAYPLARGGGALIAAAGGVVALADELTASARAGILIVVTGLGILAWRRPTPRALRWALVTAAAIGTYSVLDTAGARRSSGLTYSTGLALVVGVALTVTLIARGRGAAMLATARTQWRRHLIGGTASVTAYAMVLTAARLAPLGYVATLRETSVVLGAIAGWLLLGEHLGPSRVIASAIVASGLTLLVTWQ